ncbi:MAG: aromatic amino acid lyase, partial [Xanthomonadales bacterium]|nr:aromatic amino acid lyase [Xanthomonadales bacterium]
MIRLDGRSLTRADVAAMSGGAAVSLAPEALKRVAHAADFLARKVTAEEPIYGVNTGFGSNADKLLGARRARDDLPGGN